MQRVSAWTAFGIGVIVCVGAARDVQRSVPAEAVAHVHRFGVVSTMANRQVQGVHLHTAVGIGMAVEIRSTGGDGCVGASCPMPRVGLARFFSVVLVNRVVHRQQQPHDAVAAVAGASRYRVRRGFRRCFRVRHAAPRETAAGSCHSILRNRMVDRQMQSHDTVASVWHDTFKQMGSRLCRCCVLCSVPCENIACNGGGVSDSGLTFAHNHINANRL